MFVLFVIVFCLFCRALEQSHFTFSKELFRWA